MKFFKNKILMITGGTGSFGSSIIKSLLHSNLKEIRIFSRDEKKQEDMRLLYNNDKIKFYIGDVRIYDSVSSAIKGVDYVFHAAALKQVPSCEFYPMEAVRTNILGAENVLNAAIQKSDLTYGATSLSVSGASDLGGDVNTSTTQNYSGAVTLSGAARTLKTAATTAGDTIVFGSTVNGGYNLTVTAGNNTPTVRFNGVVGGITPLGAIAITGALDLNAIIQKTTGSTYGATSLSVSGVSDLGADVNTSTNALSRCMRSFNSLISTTIIFIFSMATKPIRILRSHAPRQPMIMARAGSCSAIRMAAHCPMRSKLL